MDRRDRRPGEGSDDQLTPLYEDDAFLSALSRGEDPSGGEDPTARLLLQLRDDVEREMPPAPEIDTEDDAEDDHGTAALISRRRRRAGGPLAYGLVGAAAASALILGGGAVITQTDMFGSGNNATVVDLAGTLDEIDRSNIEGDVEGTQRLVEQARRLLAQIERDEDDGEARSPKDAVSAAEEDEKDPLPRQTATVTETVAHPAPAPQGAEAPVTTTVTERPEAERITVTETAPAGQPTVTESVTVTETVLVEMVEPPQTAPATEPTPREGR